MKRDIFQGQYQILDEISTGGFATIFLAKEKGRHKKVALKVAKIKDDPGYAESIRKESRILSELNHKNVVSLHPVPGPIGQAITCARAIELPGRPFFFAMEYLSGGTLKNYLEQAGPLDLGLAARISWEIALSLRHIHSKNYFHNDLKMENIVFRNQIYEGKPFEPVVIDFGIATEEKLQIEMATTYIMAPEQVQFVTDLKNNQQIGLKMDLSKVDVWGLGVMLYCILTGGQPPFTGRSNQSITKRITTERPKTLQNSSNNIPPEFEKLIIDGCLAKNPQNRLTLENLIEELHRFSGNNIAPKQGTDGMKRKWFRRI